MKSSNSFSLIPCWESLPGVVSSCGAGQGRSPYSARPTCSSFIPEGSKPTCCTKPGDSLLGICTICAEPTPPHRKETLPLAALVPVHLAYTPKNDSLQNVQMGKLCVLNLAVTALSSAFLAVLKWFKVLLIHLSYLTRIY